MISHQFTKSSRSLGFELKLIINSATHFLKILILSKSISNSITLTQVLRGHLRGEDLLKQHWNYKHSYKNPLKIDNLHIQEIRMKSNKDGRYNYNPTIKKSKNYFEVYWRNSSYASPLQSSQYTDQPAHSIIPNVISDKVMFGQFKFDMNLPTVFIKNKKYLKITSFEGLDLQSRKLYKLKKSYNFSDPRHHSINSKFITAVVSSGEIEFRNTKSFVRMAIINRRNGEAILLGSSSNSKIEKNWIVAKEQKRDLIMLKSTQPFSLAKIKIATGKESVIKSNRNKWLSTANLNGGSPFVFVENCYFRIARMKFSIREIGRARLSVIVKHDLKFKEVSRSKAFVFKNTAIECCNGLDFDGQFFYFSWGENDKKMFFGFCRKNDLLEWYEKNIDIVHS